MSGFINLKNSIGVFGYIVAGFGLWAVISHGEEKEKELVKKLPEANSGKMDENRKRNALVLQVLKEASETNDNIARGYRVQK